MVEIDQVRSFLFKLFTTILIFCICHLVFELSQELTTENEETRFKRSIEENKEVLLDLPGQLNKDQFTRTKRVNTSSKRQFIATNEWQEINSDHIVPSGLHYRLNLETGKKEAKLLDKKNRSKELLAIKNDKDLKDDQRVDKLQNEFDKFKFEEKNLELNKEKDLKNWRSIDEIKKEFKDLNIKLTTDSENVHALLERFKKVASDEEKITILKDLEYSVHQYDVSKDFIKMNGLDILKDDFLNSSDEIQSLIALVLGDF